MFECCPICSAKEKDEQPQCGTHCYTTVYECGCAIDRCFGDNEWWEYSQRCDEPPKRSVMDQLMYPDTFNIAYAQETLPGFCRSSIFLAGPTPRDENTQSWRPEAVEILQKKDFKGWLYIPEMKDGWSSDFEYSNQIEWEEEGLTKAAVIVFWVPRELEKMPAFTTNVEWGYWVAKNPDKLVLGYPKDTPKMNYLDYYAKKLKIPVVHKLDDALDVALNKIEVGKKKRR